MMTKKGISPLIATVLIIGFTIVLAAVVMQWGGSFVKNLTEQQGKTADAQTQCINMDLDLEVKSTDTTTYTDCTDDSECNGVSGDCENGKCKTYGKTTTTTRKVQVTNNANVEVFKVIVQKIDVDGNSDPITGSPIMTLGPYESKSITIESADLVVAGDEIRAIPYVETEDPEGFGCSVETGETVTVT